MWKRTHVALFRLFISPLTTDNFREILDHLVNNEITGKVAERVIYEAIETPSISATEVNLIIESSTNAFFYTQSKPTGCSSKQFIEKNNLTILRDRLEIREICDECIEKYEKVARRAQKGKQSEIDKLLSLVMRESKYRADHGLAKSILLEALN